MAVVIRLARTGSKHSPRYRVTVADSRRYVTGKFLEIIGYYNPLASGKDKKVELDLTKVDSWIKKGAQPTDRVKHVIKLAQQSAQ
ncbi:MAG: 30S ribosomal protein S16 [Bdellovibrionaceae bacterium]|nr:30S ribosomal protein S16 [Pseudobdellovibrionaceae bacterium]